MTLHSLIVQQLRAAGLDPADTERVVRAALDEDLRYGPDHTTLATTTIATTTIASTGLASTAPDATGDPVSGVSPVAGVVTREAGVLAGLPVALAVLDVAGVPPEAARQLCADGDRVDAGTEVLRVTAPLRELLVAERTLLNFVTHLSGIATATRAWTEALAGTGATVRDTRKTTPGLRALEKYAVRCGGGSNHRMGLGDAALIKDNHVAAAGGITAAIEAVRRAVPDLPLEVECDTLSQVTEALAAGARLILLDNMTLPQLHEAVSLASWYPDARLEASGGLRLTTAREVAQTGVHFLAVGAITHSSPALDLGLDILDAAGGLAGNGGGHVIWRQ